MLLKDKVTNYHHLYRFKSVLVEYINQIKFSQWDFHIGQPKTKYSSVPNRRAGPNKRAGGKIKEKE